MKQLKLSVRELFMEGLWPQLLPLGMILTYSIVVSRYKLEDNWPTVIGIVAGAAFVLLLGIGLVHWKKKVNRIEKLQEATAVN